MTTSVPPEILDLARSARRITVLTGAGMSAESGIPTFRDAQTGLWTNVSPEDLATPEAWHGDPPRVWAWYAWRAGLVGDHQPNAGHRALATWAARPGVDLTVITQNIDDLHERAGTTATSHLHGSLFAYRCDTCHQPYPHDVTPPSEPTERLAPPDCSCGLGQIRPGVVWFGEALDQRLMDEATSAMETSDLVVVVGTSGMVYPAAALPGVALFHDVPVIEINPHGSELTDAVDYAWAVTAAEGLPALIAAL